MAISPKRAREAYKDVLRWGLDGAAMTWGKKAETMERYVRIATQSAADEKLEAYKRNSCQRDENDYHTPWADAKKNDEGPVQVFSDPHAPYHHPQAIEFLKWVSKEKGCRKRIVCAGDMADFHSMSRHVHETDASSPAKEYEKLLAFTAELCEAFPEGDLVLGNHDLIPQRQMKEIGLLSSMLKNSHELYGISEGWTINPLYHVIDPDGWDVLVEHGVGSGGKYGCANTSKEKSCSFVQGHIHSAAAVIFRTTHSGTTFGMNTGCLVDSNSLAMRYGKYGTRKGVLGCGVVYSGEHAEFVPMSSWPDFKG